MKVNIENISDTERRINVEIPRELVEKEYNSAYDALSHKVKIKGFRPGKVPKNILEKYFSDQVRSEVISSLVGKSYKELLEEHNIAAVSYPQIEAVELEPGTDMKYTAKVEVKPTLQVKNYTGMKLKKPRYTIVDKDIDVRLNTLRKLHGTLKSIKEERPVNAKDFVVIDFEGSIDGKPLKNGSAKDYLLQVGLSSQEGEAKSSGVPALSQGGSDSGGQGLPGFDDNIIGMKRGEEKIFTVTLSKSHPQKELADKQIAFRVTLKDIKEEILPNLDDEFAKVLGEFENIDQLRSKISEELKAEAEIKSINIMRGQILEQILSQNDFIPPSSLVESQYEDLLQDTKKRLEMQGIDQKAIDNEKMQKELRDEAGKMVKIALLLEAVADKEDISVADKELDEYIEQIAKQRRTRPEALREDYKKRGMLPVIMAKIRERKTLDWLTSKADVEEVSELIVKPW